VRLIEVVREVLGDRRKDRNRGIVGMEIYIEKERERKMGDSDKQRGGK